MYGRTILCPECGCPAPSRTHVGSKICKANTQRARLVSQGFLPLAVTVSGIVAQSGEQYLVAETRMTGGSEVWTTKQGVQFVGCCQKIGRFLGRTATDVANATARYKTHGVLLEVARKLAWHRGTTVAAPARQLSEVARVFGGVVTWKGKRYLANQSQPVQSNGRKNGQHRRRNGT